MNDQLLNGLSAFFCGAVFGALAVILFWRRRK